MGAGAMGHMETSMFEQCGYGREAIQPGWNATGPRCSKVRTRSTGRTTRALAT